MMIRYIFSDIDGTLLNADRALSARTIEQVQALNPQIPFMLVSARMPLQMRRFQQQLGIESHPVIAYNGALVLHQSEVLHDQQIPLELIREISAFNQQLSEPVHLSLYYHDEWYAPANDYWSARETNNTGVSPVIRPLEHTLKAWEKNQNGAHKIMCMGPEPSISQIFDHFSSLFEQELNLYRSKDTYIEIAHRSVSKLTGIKKVIQHLNADEDLETVMAFGDNYNDVEMISAVGHGVAVDNAREEVKKAARAHTLHHKEDGVAHYLSNFFRPVKKSYL